MKNNHLQTFSPSMSKNNKIHINQHINLKTKTTGLLLLIFKTFLPLIHKQNLFFYPYYEFLEKVCKNTLQATDTKGDNMGAVSIRPSRKAVKTYSKPMT